MLLAPSLTWLPNDRTSVTVFAQYQKDRDTPEAQGLPAKGTVFDSPNGKISRDLFIGEPGLNKYDRSGPPIDLFNPVYGSEFTFTQPYRWDNTIKQTGLYVQDQMKWDKWFLTLGGRYDYATTENTQPGSAAADMTYNF